MGAGHRVSTAVRAPIHNAVVFRRVVKQFRQRNPTKPTHCHFSGFRFGVLDGGVRMRYIVGVFPVQTCVVSRLC